MKSRTLFLIFVFAGLAVSLFYIFGNGGTTESYVNEIEKARKDKDEYMKNSAKSPFAEKRDAFLGLQYFPPDIKFRVHASLTPVSARDVVALTTNDGSTQSYLKYAWAEFDMDNLHNKLLILEVSEGADRGKLFLAFVDETSAQETYGAGRYLDVIKVPGAGTIMLDFNNAYNPYCAYSEKFTCPFPPAENVLKIAIRAGEQVYK